MSMLENEGTPPKNEPPSDGLPFHHAAHPQVRDSQPRLLADFAHCAGRDALARLHVYPPGKVSPMGLWVSTSDAERGHGQ